MHMQRVMKFYNLDTSVKQLTGTMDIVVHYQYSAAIAESNRAFLQIQHTTPITKTCRGKNIERILCQYSTYERHLSEV